MLVILRLQKVLFARKQRGPFVNQEFGGGWSMTPSTRREALDFHKKLDVYLDVGGDIFVQEKTYGQEAALHRARTEYNVA